MLWCNISLQTRSWDDDMGQIDRSLTLYTSSLATIMQGTTVQIMSRYRLTLRPIPKTNGWNSNVSFGLTIQKSKSWFLCVQSIQKRLVSCTLDVCLVSIRRLTFNLFLTRQGLSPPSVSYWYVPNGKLMTCLKSFLQEDISTSANPLVRDVTSLIVPGHRIGS